MYDCEISGNSEQAVLLLSPLREVSSYNISEVTVIINRTSITGNGAGVQQVSRSGFSWCRWFASVPDEI